MLRNKKTTEDTTYESDLRTPHPQEANRQMLEIGNSNLFPSKDRLDHAAGLRLDSRFRNWFANRNNLCDRNLRSPLIFII